MELDAIDKKLVNLLQEDFPLTGEPFADLASSLCLSETEVIERVLRLRNGRIIRIIGPVFNSRTIGYQSTLVAMRVSQERIEQAARIINRHPGVGHNYQRDHYYNLWFTLAIRGDMDLAKSLQGFKEQIHPEAIIELPAVRLFKIKLFFDVEGNGNHDEPDDPRGMERAHHVVPLKPLERAVINEAQQQLPIVPRPFDPMAKNAGMDTDEFLSNCRSLMDRGIMRRFGASIEHQNAGFVSNAMVCWAVPQPSVEAAGRKMASFKEVTHCYERKTSEAWPRYNIFTMIHGKKTSENADTVARMSRETGIDEYELLTTVREFKKERVKYLV